MKRKERQYAFTTVELLVVLAVIAMLVGLLIPALSMVQQAAKKAKQKGQFASISTGLEAFKYDYGDYPESNRTPTPLTGDYCGAQKLAEAMLGLDLLGFHPDSEFTSDGRTSTGLYVYDANIPALMNQRKGRYLEMETSEVFRLGNLSPIRPGLYNPNFTLALNPDTFVMCDVYGRTQVRMPDGDLVKAGAPVLYYKANYSASQIGQVYRFLDNNELVLVKETIDNKLHPLGNLYNTTPGVYANQTDFIYGTGIGGLLGYFQDPKVTTKVWPYRPDSYLLISAGPDGLYGSEDDICNFGN